MLVNEGNSFHPKEVSMNSIFKASIGVLFVVSTLLSSQSASAAVKAAQYPQPVLTPAAPVADDSVFLWLILGQWSNSCVQEYVTHFSVNAVTPRCIVAPCIGWYEIMLSYRGLVLTPSGSCAQMLTEYGPKFNFGALAPGEYTVTDSMTGQTVTTFTVGQPQKSLRVSGVVSEDNGILDVFKAVANCKVYLMDNIIVYTTYVDTLAKLAKVSGVIATPMTIVDSAVTNANGRYQFLSVKQGSYMLEFVAAGYQTRTVSVTVPPDTVMNVSLLTTNAMATIKGTVKETFCTLPNPFNGSLCSVSPVPGCTVYVIFQIIMASSLNKKTAADTTFLPAGPSYYGPYMAITDNNGSYVIDSVPISYDYRSAIVMVRKDGYASDSKQVSLYPNSAVIADFMLVKQFTNARSNTVNGLTFTVATDKQTYQPYEQVRVRYSVINNTMATVTFNSFGCSNFEMFVTNPLGDTVCTYPGPIECFALPPPIVLASGDTTSTEFVNFFYYDTLNPLLVTGKVAGYDKTEVAVAVFLNSGGTPVKPPAAKPAGLKQPLVSYSSLTKTLYVTIDKPQNVSIAAFSVDGKKIPQLSQARFFNSGSHAVPIGKAGCSASIVIVRVQGETFSSVKRINLAPGR
jgi:hypothetical protein